MAKSPIGIEIYKGSKPTWRVGKELGRGACATVHVLEEIDGSPTEWAIKLTPLPKKKTKKQNSTEEVNCRMLHHEHVMYQNQFQDLQGKLIPRLPPYKGPPSHGEADGFRFMILEKLDIPVFDVVPLLLNQKRSSASMISFGPIAAQLLSCVQGVQERKHVVLDIKPENFMLVSDPGKGKMITDKLASRIRILDLAMVQPWTSITSHRPNAGTEGVAGTPLYASLNVHNQETPSRRDDLEALGYVMAELLMKLASGNASKELPWSKGKSDDEIGGMKTAFVNDSKSRFYADLGGSAVTKIFKEYMDEVRQYSFKQTPEYDKLSAILMKLDVPVRPAERLNSPVPKKATRSRRRSSDEALEKTGTKRSTRSRASETRTEESPKKVSKDATYMEVEKIASDDEDSFTDAQRDIIEELDDADDNETFTTAAMDWEGVPNENEDPRDDRKPKSLVGVTIVVEDGPHKGLAVNLVKGRSESLVAGRKPSTKSDALALVLSEDLNIDDSHIRLDLVVSKKLMSVTVTDLKSSGGSFVGNERIRKGKDYRIFRGGSVRIGSSLLTVKALDPSKLSPAPNENKTAPSRKPSVKQQPKANNGETKVKQDAKTPALRRCGVTLEVTDGPHKGETFELEQGVTESYNVGSKPTGTTGKLLTLGKDQTLKPNHVSLDLTVGKRMITVSVTDKSKGDTKVNRDSVNKAKAFINDRITIGNSVLAIKPL